MGSPFFLHVHHKTINGFGPCRRCTRPALLCAQALPRALTLLLPPRHPLPSSPPGHPHATRLLHHPPHPLPLPLRCLAAACEAACRPLPPPPLPPHTTPHTHPATPCIGLPRPARCRAAAAAGRPPQPRAAEPGGQEPRHHQPAGVGGCTPRRLPGAGGRAGLLLLPLPCALHPQPPPPRGCSPRCLAVACIHACVHVWTVTRSSAKLATLPCAAWWSAVLFVRPALADAPAGHGAQPRNLPRTYRTHNKVSMPSVAAAGAVHAGWHQRKQHGLAAACPLTSCCHISPPPSALPWPPS